ncbi:MAG: electron transporter RnfD [Beggiatoa sp. IS2]|nr:MAG: electron transporter RnfD [Beggiatoa sp. IS2]
MSILISSPHAHEPISVSVIMGRVILALVPMTVFGIYLFGWPAFNLWIISLATAILAEAGCLWLMRKPLGTFLMDGSAVLAGWLFALTLPPWAPWWTAVIGSLFAIIMGKQIYGGIGQNVFNPALLGRIMLLIAFPVEMTMWISPHPLFSANAPSFLEGLVITFQGIPNIDAVSSASFLGQVRTELTMGHTVPQALANSPYTPLNAFIGWSSGSFMETSALLVLMGGIYLLVKRVITWHIPVSLLATIAILATLLHTLNPDRYPDAVFHLLSGGVMVSAFFFATDLVTSPATPVGRIVFGIGCGIIAFVIRSWGGFPEGIGFAILLMNALTPLIDHYIRPRMFGRTLSGKSLKVAGHSH